MVLMFGKVLNLDLLFMAFIYIDSSGVEISSICDTELVDRIRLLETATL